MSRRRFAMLAIAVFVSGAAAGDGADEAPVRVLPKVGVSASVPLVKVGEHKMREARFGPAAVAHGGFIYIVGGSGNASGTDGLTSIERFDPRTGASETFAQLAVGRLWHQAVLAGGKLYVLGGLGPVGDRFTRIESRDGRNRLLASGGSAERMEAMASVEIVDLATRTVARGPEMPAAKQQFAAVQAGGKIYVFGGSQERDGQRSMTNSVEVLDVAAGRWSRGGSAPTPRASVAVLVDGGFVLYPGGYTGRRALADVDLFNPRDGTWRSLPPLSKSMSSHSAAFLGHHLFLFGDYDRPEELMAYDLKTRQSEVFTLGYTNARHTAAAVVGERIYVIGGKAFRDTQPLDTIQVFALAKPKEPAGKKGD